MNGERYSELEDLISQISGTLETKQIKFFDIEWCWDYQGDDVTDTSDGALASNYSFDISVISNKL